MLLYPIIQIFFEFLRVFRNSGPKLRLNQTYSAAVFLKICILNFLLHYMRLMENYLYLLGVKRVCLCLKLNL